MSRVGRLPCAGLSIMAAVGIVVADGARTNEWLFTVGAAICATGAVLLQRTWLVLGCVMFAFASIHTIRWHGCPARALADNFGEGNLVEVEGRVMSVERRSESGWSSWIMRVERSNPSCPAGVGGGMKVRMDGDPPERGSMVKATGVVSKISGARNPGQFDYGSYMARRNVRCVMDVRAARHLVVLEAPRHDWSGFVERCRTAAFDFLELDLEDSPEIATTIRAVTLGATDDADSGLIEIFRKSGTLHLFSVSGLHVGMFAVLVYTVLKALRMPRVAGVVVSIAAIAFYVVLSGASSAAVRAGVMSAVVLAGSTGGRGPSILNSLFAAAFVLLALDTNQLFNVGFQLSFSAILGIMVFYHPTLAVMRPLISHDPFLPEKLVSPFERSLRKLLLRGAEGGAVSVAAVIGTAVPSWYHFQIMTPISVVANLVVAPLAFCMLALGMASLLSGSLGVVLPTIWNNANWLVTHGVLWCVGLFASVPGGSVYVATYPWKRDGRLAELLIMDLRRGEAVLARTEAGSAMVNAGSQAAYEFVVRDVLAAHGVNRLERMLFTRGDANYYGGGPGAIREFLPREMIVSRVGDSTRWRQQTHNAAVEAGVRVVEVAKGDRFELLPGVGVNVLYPDASLERRTAQDRAMVLLLEIRQWRILMMSGAGFNTLADLLEETARLYEADLVITGAVGSESLEPFFIKRADPAAIVGRGLGEADNWHLVQWINPEANGGVRLVVYSDRIRAEPFLGSGEWVFRR